MIKIGILGDIGSGKTFIANQFGYPVFSADEEVSKIYKNNKSCFRILKKNFPNHIFSFPINKKEISKLILTNKKNLKKINKIVHPIVRVEMNKFIDKNKRKKMIILDIPLLLENKIKKKDFILVFVDAKKKQIIKNLKKRKNYNVKIINLLKNFQLSLNYKKKISNFIIKNDFKMKPVKKSVNIIKTKILHK